MMFDHFFHMFVAPLAGKAEDLSLLSGGESCAGGGALCHQVGGSGFESGGKPGKRWGKWGNSMENSSFSWENVGKSMEIPKKWMFSMVLMGTSSVNGG